MTGGKDDRRWRVGRSEAGNVGVRVERHTRGVRVAFEGELDLAAAPELDTAVARLSSDGEPIFLDLAGVRFVDSAGFRVLMDVTGDHTHLTIDRLSPAVERYASLTGLRLSASASPSSSWSAPRRSPGAP
jgi:anti-anti-sigma factor